MSQRSHENTAIARSTSRVSSIMEVHAVPADINDQQSMAATLSGYAAVISSVLFSDSNPDNLIGAVNESGVTRYLVVGGAGSLQVPPGTLLVDTPDFPAEYKAKAQGGVEFLAKLRQEDALEWTFLTPSALFIPGQRTGEFRLWTDQLLMTDDGSRISFEDYAMALTDEIEHPQHVRQQFTVGYRSVGFLGLGRM